MKQVARSLIVVGAMMAAGAVAADMDMDFRPFIGVDFLQAWTEGKGNLTNTTISAKDAFKKSYPGATVYVGSKFTDYFGVELGADWSSKQKRTATGNITVGAVTTTGVTYKNKTSRQGFHGDLIGFLPMDCWELFGSVGYGSVRMKISDQTLTTAAGAAVTGTSNFTPLDAKRKGVFRLGLGASYMFTDMFGVRAKLGWEGTQALRLKYANNFATDSKSFKNTTTLAVGVFARW